MNKYLFFMLINLIVFNRAFGQVSKVIPAKPTAIENVDLVYDPSLPSAKLSANEIVYARITNYMQDGSINKFHQVLENKNGKLITRLILPRLTASFKVEFYTLNREDEAATQNIMVYDKDFKPVKGAYLDAFFSNKVDSLFLLESERYPTHFLAYAKYFNVVGMIKDPVEGKAQIKKLIKKLDSLQSKGSKEDIAGLLAAFCVGYAKTGDLTTAKKNLFQLFDTYPLASETAFAFSIYNYEYYKMSTKSIEADVKDRIKAIFIAHPNAAICKDSNVFEYLRSDKSIPTNAFEKVIKDQIEKGELAYYALGNLSELYIDRNENLEAAKILLLQAIRSYQTGEIQHQYRLTNGHYQMYVPFFLFDLAKINLIQNEPQAAVTNTSAAIQILAGSSAEGNYLPLILELRAKSYQKMGNFNMAMDDYKKLYLNGNVAVVDSMKRLFPLSNLKQKTFEDFLYSLKAVDQKQLTSKNLLTNFKGTDLSGKQFSLTDLKGKIVVLNVWGIGCGPCIAEMPQLNELVKVFSKQTDVVFIAVTADQTADLTKFFKSRTFDYKVIGNVNNITETFNTNSLPVHMVIDRNGEIINRSIGARENIKSFLKGIVEANL